MSQPELTLVLIGFGNVARRFVKLLGETADRLCPEHHPWFVDTVRASAPGR